MDNKNSVSQRKTVKHMRTWQQYCLLCLRLLSQATKMNLGKHEIFHVKNKNSIIKWNILIYRRKNGVFKFAFFFSSKKKKSDFSWGFKYLVLDT